MHIYTLYIISKSISSVLKAQSVFIFTNCDQDDIYLLRRFAQGFIDNNISVHLCNVLLTEQTCEYCVIPCFRLIKHDDRLFFNCFNIESAVKCQANRNFNSNIKQQMILDDSVINQMQFDNSSIKHVFQELKQHQVVVLCDQTIQKDMHGKLYIGQNTTSGEFSLLLPKQFDFQIHQIYPDLPSVLSLAGFQEAQIPLYTLDVQVTAANVIFKFQCSDVTEETAIQNLYLNPDFMAFQLQHNYNYKMGEITASKQALLQKLEAVALAKLDQFYQHQQSVNSPTSNLLRNSQFNSMYKKYAQLKNKIHLQEKLGLPAVDVDQSEIQQVLEVQDYFHDLSCEVDLSDLQV
ncbi:Hypothetical_protein [Hexamita inflata]|uniref:Hypothetical_protein n=1 Tax=Hexamita inflata TaxID=28002 RepID=A0AA86NPM6_9EUKA|nr:Hypothetical protein HINF_LOCUS11113 [Hexamita inflata]